MADQYVLKGLRNKHLYTCLVCVFKRLEGVSLNFRKEYEGRYEQAIFLLLFALYAWQLGHHTKQQQGPKAW